MDSTAQQLGFVVGMILAVFAMIAIPSLFIVSLILAVRRKTRGWIVAAVVTGLLSLPAVGLFFYGAYTGISRSRSFTAPEQDIPDSREVVSDDGLCAVTIPTHWKLLENVHEGASLQAGNLLREEYLIVLTDLKQDFSGTLEQHAEITSENMIAALESATKSEPATMEIGGFPAIRYEIAGVSDLVNIVYVQTTVEGTRGFYQVLGWTISSKADTARGVLEEVANSFREIEPSAE